MTNSKGKGTTPRLLEAIKRHPPFAQKVWLACCTIPEGKVRTYGWIAKKIGRPGAARAVGSALARNPFAPGVPCHRVVRSDGKLGGYSGEGGAAQKLKMLRAEGAILQGKRLKNR